MFDAVEARVQKRQNSYDMSREQIVELWLDMEVQGFDWRRIGPEDLSKCQANMKAKIEKQVWACRVVDDAFSRMLPSKSNVGVVKGLVVHVVHHGKDPESFWLYEIGARRLDAVLERFWRCVDTAAKAAPREAEFETA